MNAMLEDDFSHAEPIGPADFDLKPVLRPT